MLRTCDSAGGFAPQVLRWYWRTGRAFRSLFPRRRTLRHTHCETHRVIIDRVINAGALPTLEAAAQFAGRRHEVIAHNIANISTPGFQPAHVSVEAFREQLRDAIDDRRDRSGDVYGDLRLGRSREVSQSFDRSGQSRLELNPSTPSGNILFHDRNNRDLERMMQALTENAAAFRSAAEMFKSNLNLVKSAIALRV